MSDPNNLKTVAAHRRGLEAMDRMVAMWTDRVATGWWNTADSVVKRCARDSRLIERGMRAQSDPIGRHEFLGAALDRIEQILDRIEGCAAGRNTIGPVGGALVEADRWLSFVEWAEWPADDFSQLLFARSVFLKMRTETHPVWSGARIMDGSPLKLLQREPTFVGIARVGGVRVGGDEQIPFGPKAGGLVREAFRKSLQHGCTTHFKECGPLRQAMFVGFLSGKPRKDEGVDRAMPEQRVAWLLGGEETSALKAVGRMFYPQAD